MRVLLALVSCWLATGAIAADKKNDKAAPPAPAAPNTGIHVPGVQIPMESLKPEAQIPVETPGGITFGDSIFVSNPSKDAVVRIDAKTNKAVDPFPDMKKPCAGTIVAFGSLWIPNCGAQSVTRVDPKTGKVAATLAIGAADVTVGLASTADSVWMMTDSKTTLTRIDPIENKVVGELRLPAGCNSLAFGSAALWVTCPAENRIYRVDPQTNLVDKRIDVSGGPRALAFGDNSVWVLCEKDGKIDRIDPKTNKVIKTIDLAVPNAGGGIAFGEGFLWVSQAGFPLTRIDYQSEKERVVQQFWGEGGGMLSVTTGAVWVANLGKGGVSRFDPKRVIATLAE